MDGLLAWFDLDATGASVNVAGGPEMPLAQQVLLYSLVVVGVLLSEAIAMARVGGPVSVGLSLPWVATACVVALVIFPAVWRDIGVMGEASLLVQMGLATQGGVFWGVLMAGAEKQVRRPVTT